jgi:purine-binding chemotaxis protein CheW
MSQEPRQAAAIELLVFELAGVRYGIDLASVREVARAVFITPLPEAPPVVEGVIDARGTLVPVYDLRLRFGLPPRPLHPDERMVLAWTGARLAAFRCDAAGTTAQVEVMQGDGVDAVVRGGRQVSGVARLPDGLVLIHDLAGFLDDAERLTLDDALAALDERAAG